MLLCLCVFKGRVFSVSFTDPAWGASDASVLCTVPVSEPPGDFPCLLLRSYTFPTDGFTSRMQAVRSVH